MAKRVRKSKAEKSAAVLTIHGPGRMTKRGRRAIATLLRKHADWLLKHGDDYTDGRFTGRFIYT